MTLKKSFIIFPAFIFSVALQAQTTHVVIRAKAKAASPFGISHTVKYGSAFVTLKDAATGKVYAKGAIGGDAEQPLSTKARGGEAIDTASKVVKKTGSFEADLKITEPTLVTVEITAPSKKRYSGKPSSAAGFTYPAGESIVSSTQLWVIPGKNIDGEGHTIEIPGFILDIQQSFPSGNEFNLSSLQGGILPVKAFISLMCGCKVTPGGKWPAENVEIAGWLLKDGVKIQEVAFAYADTSLYSGNFNIREKGDYEIKVYAYDRVTFNTSVDWVKLKIK